MEPLAIREISARFLSQDERVRGDVDEIAAAREGTLYCCVVLDQFSRRIAGWAIDRRNDAVLVNEALSMAARERETSTETILHSDHGSGFISWSFSQNLRHHKLLGSMGMTGSRLLSHALCEL